MRRNQGILECVLDAFSKVVCGRIASVGGVFDVDVEEDMMRMTEIIVKPHRSSVTVFDMSSKVGSWRAGSSWW